VSDAVTQQFIACFIHKKAGRAADLESFRLKLSVACLAVFCCVLPASGYSPVGHEIVGAIADKRLANTPEAAKIAKLLDGISLERASVMADEIRAWDKRGADDPAVFHYLAYPKIDNQLREFWRANPPTRDLDSSVPSHHWFHYTDVPVLDLAKYSDGKTGRSKWDIVHMIGYCVSVLKGETPEDNPRKITKPVAIILLAHYVGDIHQPLHVGAQYFDEEGRAINPDKGGQGFKDNGGNGVTLQLKESMNGNDHGPITLHSFWDRDAVMANLVKASGTISKEEQGERINAAKRELIGRLAKEEPKNWELSHSIALGDYAENWANEILPVAREAHERLQFKNVRSIREADGRTVASGEAEEKEMPDHMTYGEWSGRVVRQELHKAGWRLADLLEKAVQ
jgi:hypothetical protein